MSLQRQRSKRPRSVSLSPDPTPPEGVVRILRLLSTPQSRLAAAEAKFQELQSTIDALLGKGFLETDEVRKVLESRRQVEQDHSHYGVSSRAVAAHNNLRQSVLSTLSKSASRQHVGLYEIDHATTAACCLPPAVVPTVVAKNAVLPFVGHDWLVILHDVIRPDLRSSFTSDRSPLMIIGAMSPIPTVVEQLKKIPQKLFVAFFSKPTSGPTAVSKPTEPSKQDRFRHFLYGFCQRVTEKDEMQSLHEALVSVQGDRTTHDKVEGLCAWLALRCGALSFADVDDITADALIRELPTSLVCTEGFRDEILLPLAANTTASVAGILLDALISSPMSAMRPVLLSAEMRDGLFLKWAREFADDLSVSTLLPSLLEAASAASSMMSAARFFTATFRDGFFLHLANFSDAGYNLPIALDRLVDAAPITAQTSLCTPAFRDGFFVKLAQDPASESFDYVLGILRRLVEMCTPAVARVFATIKFAVAFFVPALPRLDELAATSTKDMAVILQKLSAASKDRDKFLEPISSKFPSLVQSLTS